MLVGFASVTFFLGPRRFTLIAAETRKSKSAQIGQGERSSIVFSSDGDEILQGYWALADLFHLAACI